MLLHSLIPSQYPSAEILGNDISPIQPSLVPPNVKFEVDDIEQEWFVAVL